MKLLKKLIPYIIGCSIGYLVYYFFLMEIVSRFIGSTSIIDYAVSILMLLGCVAACTMVAALLIYKETSKCLFAFLYVAYLLVLLLVLFGRSHPQGQLILNPLVGLQDLSDWEMQQQSILNVLVFVPLGYLFRDFSKYKSLVLSIFVPILIETLQYITMRGFFDTFDMLLYFIGIQVGIAIFKRLKIKLV